MSRPTRSLRRNALSAFVQFSLPLMLAAPLGHAATCSVNSATDDPTDASAKVTAVPPGAWSGANASVVTLRDCIVAANLMTGASGVPTNPGMTIVMDNIAGSTITLADSLPLIFNNSGITMLGSGAPVIIDGGGVHRIFFISGLPDSTVTPPPDPDGAQAISVGMDHLVLQNGKAAGGSGHAGGLGAGGALFVNKNASVVLNQVDVKTNSAQGGPGDTATSVYGGGGMGGNSSARGGGGLSGNGVNAGFSFGGGIGIDSAAGTGGGFGGTGIGQLSGAQGFASPAFNGASNFAAPNGGIGGGGYRYGAGGFGGGGGASSGASSPGGFGGGGGAVGESGSGSGGGFGGGAGAMGGNYSYNSVGTTGASGGFGAGGAGGMSGNGCTGGTGATGTAGGAGGAGGIGGGIGVTGSDGCNVGRAAGGGGAGLGGGVFVRAGGSLVVQTGATGTTVSGNTVLAGTGGAAGPTGPTLGGGNGAAAGNGLFLMGGAVTVFDVAGVETISDNIQDDSAVSLPGGSYTQGSGSGASITKSGTGKLVFAAGTVDTYQGATTVNGGTLQVDGVLIASPTVVNSGGTLAGNGSVQQAITLNSGGAIAPGDSPGTLFGGSLLWNGDGGGGAQMNFELGPTGSGDSDELDLNGSFNKGTAGTFKFHFTDGTGGPPTPGTIYTLVRYTSTTFTLDASDFSFDYSGAFAGTLQGTFALTGSSPPPAPPVRSAPQSALPPNALTFAVAATPPTIAKSFAPASIPQNGTTTLTFNIGNPNSTSGLSNISFTDAFPSGLAVAATPNLSDTCGGSFTPAPTSGDTSLSYSGGVLAASATCSISIDVTGLAAGSLQNSTGGITAAESLTAQGTPGSALLTVVAPPGFAKGFNPAAIGPAGTSTLTFTIQNTNSVALSGVTFTDNFPAGLVVAATPNAVDNCGGTFTATAGAGSVSLAGGTINANATCTLSVAVHGTTTGAMVNTTLPISSTEGGSGGTATATLTVNSTPVRLQSFEVN